MTLWLHGLGHFHPENEISNAFLEGLDIGTSDAWILERTGIRARRTCLDLDYIRTTRNGDVREALDACAYTTGQMGAHAARMALERAGLGPEAIGLVLAGSSASDWVSPADACNVAAELGIDLPALDVNSACTSFLAQIHLLSLMDPTKLPDYVLIVGTDALTRTVNYAERDAAVLWGDGSAAAVISTRIPGRARYLGSALDSRPSSGDAVVVPRIGYFDQEGRAVQAFAIRNTALGYERLRTEHGRDDRDLHFVGHQANLRMLESVCRRCDIPDDRHHHNVEWFGNTGAASSATVISQSWGKWAERDDVAVAGVGAGLTWASYLLRFEGGEAG